MLDLDFNFQACALFKSSVPDCVCTVGWEEFSSSGEMYASILLLQSCLLSEQDMVTMRKNIPEIQLLNWKSLFLAVSCE